MNDKKLLKLIKSDANEGMYRLISQYSGLVFTIVRGRLSDVCSSAEIEDCVSEVFIKFYRSLDAYRGDASVKTYIGVIAKNTAAGYARSAANTVELNDEALVADFSVQGDIDDALDEKQLARKLIDEIRALGKPDSEILIRKYYLEQSSKSIAKALGMSVQNVDTRTHRAITKLKSRLETR